MSSRSRALTDVSCWDFVIPAGPLPRLPQELYSKTTRFALACNVSSKIIEPIQSRCAIIRFTRLDDRDVVRRVRDVLLAENILQYDASGIEAIVFTAQGDMRQALNNLQSTYAGTGNVTAENVFRVVDQPHPMTVQAILRACDQGMLEEALVHLQAMWEQVRALDAVSLQLLLAVAVAVRSRALLHRCSDACFLAHPLSPPPPFLLVLLCSHLHFPQGYAAVDIVGTLFRVCKTAEISDPKKLVFIREIGMAHLRISDGCNSLLQLTAYVPPSSRSVVSPIFDVRLARGRAVCAVPLSILPLLYSPSF